MLKNCKITQLNTVTLFETSGHLVVLISNLAVQMEWWQRRHAARMDVEETASICVVRS